MPGLKYLIGDATDPIHKPTILVHCCNDGEDGKPAWGRGFVVALSKRYSKPEKAYRDGFKTGHPKLGNVQYVEAAEGILVANIIGQHGIAWQGKTPPIRYDAIEKGLIHVYDQALSEGFSVSMPRIGAALAGGDWGKIEAIIKRVMTVDSYVYTLDFEKDKWETVYEI